MECHPALKTNEALIQATTRMDLEDITLSEISQIQKDTHCMIPLREGPSHQIQRRKVEWRLTGAGGGGGGVVLSGDTVSVWEEMTVRGA